MGVALCMGPYNYPLNETFSTLFPALLMGNTVVFKPPSSACCWCPAAGGVPGLLPARRHQHHLRPRPGWWRADGERAWNLFAFIGTNKGASELKKQPPKRTASCVLGLDAKNPAIVLEDADLDNAVKECLPGTLSFNGQRCTALKMLLVHRKIVEPFLRRFVGSGQAQARHAVGAGGQRHAAARARQGAY